jgi:hypothetical protein
LLALMLPHVVPDDATGKSRAVVTTIKLLSKQREGYLCFGLPALPGRCGAMSLLIWSYVGPLPADILENETILNERRATVMTTTKFTFQL